MYRFLNVALHVPAIHCTYPYAWVALRRVGSVADPARPAELAPSLGRADIVRTRRPYLEKCAMGSPVEADEGRFELRIATSAEPDAELEPPSKSSSELASLM